MVRGYFVGFSGQAMSLVGWFGGIFLALRFFTPLGAFMSKFISAPQQVSSALAFAAIMITAVLGASILGYFIKEFFVAIKLGFVNKILGSLFGIVKTALAVYAVLTIGLQLSKFMPPDWIEKSVVLSFAYQYLDEAKLLIGKTGYM